MNCEEALTVFIVKLTYRNCGKGTKRIASQHHYSFLLIPWLLLFIMEGEDNSHIAQCSE